MEIQKKSVDDLLEFLEFVAEKGLMKPTTASSRKVAINKVFSVLDEEERKDVFSLDIDSVIERFNNKYSMDVKPDTLRIYKSRIHSSIEDFERYQEDPVNFKLATQSRATSSNPKKAPSHAKVRSSRFNEGLEGETNHMGMDEMSFSIPVPLRDGVIVYIRGLPFDLTEEEARKIARVIEAYAPPSKPS